MDGTGSLSVSILGPVTAARAGVPLDLGGPRQRAVLALLVLARGDVVSADALVESVWGDRPPSDPANGLQAYVSHLRRRLEPGSAARARSQVIVREGRGYAVRLPREAVDAWRFEQLLQEAGGAPDAASAGALLTEALALWSGPALADYADEPWAAAEVGRLTELKNTARERLLAARLDLGEAALLVPDLEAMVEAEPLREERWRLLALALYRCGRQADALAALRRARTTLADELGVDPGPALRRLEDDVLAQAPSLRPADPMPAEPPPTVASRIPSPRPAAPLPSGSGAGPGSGPSAAGVTADDDLADRDSEVDAVRTAVDALAAGEPRLVLIEGPAGIGKTRLLAEARRLAAERSLRVLTARGSQLEKAFGFGVVRQLFEPELLAPERRGVLLGGAASAAGAVFELAAGEPDSSFAIMHGLYWLAVNLTGAGPFVLAVDDLQWCDAVSLRWLAYLARRLDGVPVLLVATIRTGEAHDDEELLAELQMDPAAVLVRPGPLSADATARMIAGRLGEPVSPLFSQACHRTTGGNPLLLRQLLRGLDSDRVRPDAAHADRVVAVGSRAVASMVLMRLRRLPPEVLPVARAAAVLGQGASLPAVAALAERPEKDTAAALALLSRAEIVKNESPPAFVHPLVREAVYRDLPAGERALLHERAARVLAGAPVEDVAAHLLLAPGRGDDGTVALLQRAARTAAERGASDTAVTLLRRALEEPPSDALRRDVLTDLGMLEAMLDGSAGIEHLLQAYALHEDPRARADLAVTIAQTQIFASPPGVATAFAREARLVVPADLDDHRQALLALERIGGFMHGLDAAIWRVPAPPDPTGEGYGARMLAATLSFETTLAGGDRGRAVELARFALDRDRLWAVDSGLSWVVATVVRVLADDDDLGEFWRRARAAASARRSVFAVHATNLWQGFWHWRRGELDEALTCLRVAYDQAQLWGHVAVGNPYTRAFEVACHLDRGDVAAARRSADAGLAGPIAGDGGRLLQHAAARLLVAEGRFEEGLGAVVGIATPVPIANPVWHPWRTTAALALHGLGRTDQALALQEEEVRLLREWGAASYLGNALRVLGQLEGLSGLDHLREAVALLGGTSAAVDLARARCALGASPGLPDDEALPLLREASAAAAELGAQGVLRRSRAALQARGCADDHDHIVAAPRRSGMERPVLELAGSGLGVHEIAQRLFLTPGTVSAVLQAADGGGLKFFSSPPTDAVRREGSGVP